MVTPENIRRLEQDARRNNLDRFAEVQNIRARESFSEKQKRIRMGIEWNSRLPILECRWHIDYCFYDGNALENVSTRIESSILGGIDFGTNFLHYNLCALSNGEHFEQCPGCYAVYKMGPSPEQLEKLRIRVPPVFGNESRE